MNDVTKDLLEAMKEVIRISDRKHDAWDAAKAAIARADVIRMAREAGFTWEPINNIAGPLERFAALVAAAEREAWPDLTCVIQWLEAGCDPKDAAKELRLLQDKIRARGQK